MMQQIGLESRSVKEIVEYSVDRNTKQVGPVKSADSTLELATLLASFP